MANASIAAQTTVTSEPASRNGFPVLTRDEIAGQCATAMQAFDDVQTILKSIGRIVGADAEVVRLVDMGSNITAVAHNDLDVMQECADKAGVAGELV